MSVQQSIQTGVIIGQAIQTARMRQELAQVQQLLVMQQNQQEQLAAWRQIMFEARKLLDAAAAQIDQDPVGAVYLIRLAGLSLGRVPETTFPGLQDKESLYQMTRYANTLLVQGEGRLSPEIARDLHRLAWREQMRPSFLSFKTWLEIEEKIQDAAIVFIPGAAIFFSGMVLANIIAPLSWMMLHVAAISCLLWLATNGITLFIIASAARSRVLAACDLLAKKAGGWVGPNLTRKGAAALVEQARAHLSSWGCKSTVTSSYEAGKGLAAVDAEIVQLRQLYFAN